MNVQRVEAIAGSGTERPPGFEPKAAHVDCQPDIKGFMLELADSKEWSILSSRKLYTEDYSVNGSSESSV